MTSVISNISISLTKTMYFAVDLLTSNCHVINISVGFERRERRGYTQRKPRSILNAE